MRKTRDPKTPDQLIREIAYYAQELRRGKSPDRIRRAHIAIRTRERLLAEASRAAVAATIPSITCPTCRLVSYNPSDIRQKYCGFCHRFHTDRTPEVSS